MKTTHVLLNDQDLALLESTLGPAHDICTRVRHALDELDDPALAKYRVAARVHVRDGDLEIDPGAVVSQGADPGAYVMAWLWIADEELS
jgi:hypothetical protein